MTEERLRILRKVKGAYKVPVQAANDLGYTIKRQATDLDISPKTIYGATNAANLQHLPTLDLMIAHINNLKAFFATVEATANAYAAFDEIEFLLGRVAFALPDIPEDCNEFAKLVGETVSEFGDVLHEGGEMMRDGKVKPDEYGRFETEVIQLIRKAMAQLNAAKDLRDKYVSGEC